MPRTRVQPRQNGRIVPFSIRRTVLIFVALGLALSGGVPTATATQPDPDHKDTHKDYVCKYVGKPGVDERLQTGNNPIWVDTVATGRGWATDLFNDAQRSYVIVAETLKLDPEPGIDQCPNVDRPEQPDPLVSRTHVTDTTCDVFTTTTTTTTTKYVWSDAEEKWILGTPEVTTSVDTRKPTADEIAAKGLVCTQPATLVTTRTVESTTCTAFTSTVITTTTAYVLTNGSWVLGDPVVTTADPVVTTPTAKQIKDADLFCPPEQPAAKVVVTPEHTTSCTEYSVRDVTVTTPYVWNAETQAWELGRAGKPVVGEWVTTAPTHQQIKDAGLVCKPEQPRRPDPILTSSVTFDTTCTAFTTTTTSTITEYVLRDGVWVLGDPVETTGKPVVSTPTAEQIAGLPGLHCTVDVPPVDVPPATVVLPEVTVLGVSVTANPKVTRPAKASVSVLGVSATANPLPVAASAGAADTSGQVAAGGLTGLAAFLAFGAAFMLRRRRGVV